MGTRDIVPSDEWVRASGSRVPAGMARVGRPTVGRYPTLRVPCLHKNSALDGWREDWINLHNNEQDFKFEESEGRTHERLQVAAWMKTRSIR